MSRPKVFKKLRSCNKTHPWTRKTRSGLRSPFNHRAILAEGNHTPISRPPI